MAKVTPGAAYEPGAGGDQARQRWAALRNVTKATAEDDVLPNTRYPSRQSFFATEAVNPDWWKQHFLRESEYYFFTILYMVDIRGVLLAGSSIGLTYGCNHYWELFIKFPSSFVALSVVFPIVMTIKDAQARRDKALRDLASIKATGYMLYMMHSHWGATTVADMNVTGTCKEGEAMREALGYMWSTIAAYLKSNGIEVRQQRLLEVYHSFHRIDLLNQQLGGGPVGTPVVAGTPIDMERVMLPVQMLSRANQYLKIIITDFEECRTVKDYRTSRYLRAYGIIFMNLSPLLLAPYFAQISKDSGNDYAGILSAMMFSFILVSLHHIQLHLEDPFDGDGEDDIFVEGMVREMRGYMHDSRHWTQQFRDFQRVDSEGGLVDLEAGNGALLELDSRNVAP